MSEEFQVLAPRGRADCDCSAEIDLHRFGEMSRPRRREA